MPSIRKISKDPINTLITNFHGTLNLLEMAKINKAKILFASSSEVYGNPENHPQKKVILVTSIQLVRACYEEGKRIAETLFYDFHRKYKTDISVARIFNLWSLDE